jgi:hypothetical protein
MLHTWLTRGRAPVPLVVCRRDVADNSITGVIPAEWATGMSSLRMANVSNNSLAGWVAWGGGGRGVTYGGRQHSCSPSLGAVIVHGMQHTLQRIHCLVATEAPPGVGLHMPVDAGFLPAE